jgi:hypothetical protein
MGEVASHGDPDLIPLLQSAGVRVSERAKKLPITLPDGKFTFEQFRQHCIERLKPAGQPPSKVRRESRGYSSPTTTEIAKPPTTSRWNCPGPSSPSSSTIGR